MELTTRFNVLIFGLILILSSCFLLHECKKLNGYKFPVYSIKFCPRNQKEWNQRSSAINCTENNGYLCLPNENFTELLEFCYQYPFILIQEDICLYLSKRYSAVYSHDCTGFRYGCPNSSYASYKLFEKHHCTSIGNGCFLAEPSCQSLTSTTYLQETSENIESKNTWILVGTFLGVFITTSIFCLLYIVRKKGTRICKRNGDVENPEELIPLMPRNQGDKKGSSEDTQLDESIIEDWLKDNNFFVPTKACGEVEKLINSQNFVVVAGHSGSGKTTIIQHIALKFRSQGWIVKPVNKVIDIIEIVNSPKNNLDERTVVVLNDPIGKESFDDIEFHSWKKHEETLKACLKKVKLLVSCRIYILNDNRVKGILKDKSNIVDICNDQLKLSKNEKKDIWQIYASNETITKEELTQIVQCEAYFPLLCKLYFMGKHKQKDRLNFFTKPVQIFEEEIRDFKNFCKEKYCSLIQSAGK